MTIVLPIPHRDLWPNSRKHWRVKAKAVSQARHAAYLATYSMIQSLRLTGALTFTGYGVAVFYPDRRRRDDDNMLASLKSHRDGIADALGVDDNTLRLAALPTFQVDKLRPRVEITLIP